MSVLSSLPSIQSRSPVHWIHHDPNQGSALGGSTSSIPSTLTDLKFTLPVALKMFMFIQNRSPPAKLAPLGREFAQSIKVHSARAGQ